MKDDIIYNLKLTKEELEAIPVLKNLAMVYIWELYDKKEDDIFYEKHKENMDMVAEYHKTHSGIMAITNNMANKISKLIDNYVCLSDYKEVLTELQTQPLNVTPCEESDIKYLLNFYKNNINKAIKVIDKYHIARNDILESFGLTCTEIINYKIGIIEKDYIRTNVKQKIKLTKEIIRGFCYENMRIYNPANTDKIQIMGYEVELI